MEIENIIKYAEELKTLPYDLGADARIIVKDGKTAYELLLAGEITKDNLTKITDPADVEKAALISLSYNYMIIACSPFIGMSAKESKNLPAVLDDMGMIIGRKAPLADISAKSISKAIKRHRACICSDGYAVCCGTDIYEAFTCHTILAKNAEIYHKAKAIGGAKPIRLIAGIRENRIYRKKYSKLERSGK